jgi:integrase
MKLHKLSERFCRSAPVGLHGDGGGLHLKVKSKTARSWLYLYSSNDKRTELGLGPYPAIGLSRARELAAEYRTARAEGLDPRQERDRKRERSATFASAAEEMLSDLGSGWSERHRDAYRRSLMVGAARLASLPIAAISTDDVLAVLAPIWPTDGARRLQRRLETLLDWAKARGLRQGENVARWRGHMAVLLPKRSKVQRHYPAMQYQDVPAFLAEARDMSGYGARGLELLILTATRSNEIIGARWSEFNLDARPPCWVIPAERMKNRKEHRVPLSSQAIKVLNELAAIKRGDYLLPSWDASRHASHSVLQHAVKRLGRTVPTVHGFRSSFADFAREQVGAAHELIELSLFAQHRVCRRASLFQNRLASAACDAHAAVVGLLLDVDCRQRRRFARVMHTC